MRVLIAVSALVALFAQSAAAWNDRGHTVVAQLAYERLTPEQRQAVLTILQQHPHWQEFLAADRPDAVPVDQWAFWRAAVWPDWVKEHHEQFSHPTWHYIDYPFVPPGSSVQAQSHPPKPENVLTALPLCIDKTRSATGAERAINLCWVLHLVGDIHQPLHCISLYCEQFPKGDHGGNDALFRLGMHRVIKLHPFWDDLLGKSVTPTTVTKAAQECQAALAANRAEVTREEQANPGVESWAKESYTMAATYAYLSGKVIPATADRHKEPAEVPEVAEAYAEEAGLIARVCIAKAGERLTAVLGQVVP